MFVCGVMQGKVLAKEVWERSQKTSYFYTGSNSF